MGWQPYGSTGAIKLLEAVVPIPQRRKQPHPSKAWPLTSVPLLPIPTFPRPHVHPCPWFPVFIAGSFVAGSFPDSFSARSHLVCMWPSVHFSYPSGLPCIQVVSFPWCQVLFFPCIQTVFFPYTHVRPCSARPRWSGWFVAARTHAIILASHSSYLNVLGVPVSSLVAAAWGGRVDRG